MLKAQIEFDPGDVKMEQGWVLTLYKVWIPRVLVYNVLPAFAYVAQGCHSYSFLHVSDEARAWNLHACINCTTPIQGRCKTKGARDFKDETGVLPCH